jgi:hypothetical protein
MYNMGNYAWDSVVTKGKINKQKIAQWCQAVVTTFNFNLQPQPFCMTIIILENKTVIKIT